MELCINSPSVLNGIRRDNNLNLQKYRNLSQAYVKRIRRHYFHHFSEKRQVMPTKCYRDIGLKIAEVGRYSTSVGIVTSSMTEVWYFDFQHEKNIFLQSVQTVSEKDTASSSIVPVVRIYGIYWPEHEADISPQSTAFHSPTCLYAVVVNKVDGKTLSSIFV